jgi:hypothetical protein
VIIGWPFDAFGDVDAERMAVLCREHILGDGKGLVAALNARQVEPEGERKGRALVIARDGNLDRPADDTRLLAGGHSLAHLDEELAEVAPGEHADECFGCII